MNFSRCSRLLSTRNLTAFSARRPQSILRPPTLQQRYKSDAVSAATTAATDSTASVVQAVIEAAPALAGNEIGYFESLGLAQGWLWPTDLCLHAMEYVHAYTGMPWWATIVALGAASRIIVLPLMFKSYKMNMKLKVVKPMMNKLQEQMRSAATPQEKAIAQLRLSKLGKMHGISMPVVVAGGVAQIPIAYGFFMAIKKMAEVPVAGMTTEGALWFQDLATTDPYLGLSVISAATMYTGFKLGGEMGNAANMGPSMRTAMTYIPPAMMIGMGLWYSAANVLFFSVTGFLSMLQTLFMRTAYFRRLMDIPDEIFVKAQVAEKASSQTSITEQYKSMWADAKERAQAKANPEPKVVKPPRLVKPVTPVRVVKKKQRARS